VADDAPELVASYYTLTGSGFGEPPRHSFADRCRAAAEAGFTGIGLHADDVARTVAGGLDVPRMRSVLAEHGLRVVEIEFLGGWALDGPDPAVVEGIEATADAFGGRHVTAGELGAADRLDLDAAAQRLGAVSRRLGGRGLNVALEAFPWSAIPDPATAIELLHRTEAPNAGLMIDVWHFFNAGADPALLAGLPPAAVVAVQLNDGPRVHEDHLHHARSARMLPGEGDLDVTGLVDALRRNGFDGPWCVEVNTPAFRALPVGEAARQAADAALAVLDPARVAP
jgi:sugar phosphate isomerase/epimerase